jgi:molybdate transport system substrate-binding protein
MPESKTLLMAFFCGALLFFFHIPAVKSEEIIRVFAASSLTGALSEITHLYRSQNDIRVSTVFASSSTLAKQVLNGAPADIFISANQVWMDQLEKSSLLVPGSRRALLGNTLSLIAPASIARPLNLYERASLEQALNGGRMAIGDPDHVPAGMYAKSAFSKLGYWKFVKTRIVATPNVRAALAFVERGEVNLGVVYASDITGRPEVKEVARFPDETHPAIIYPMGLVRGRALPYVRRFFDFLQSDAARVIFTRYGFSWPDYRK